MHVRFVPLELLIGINMKQKEYYDSLWFSTGIILGSLSLFTLLAVPCYFLIYADYTILAFVWFAAWILGIRYARDQIEVRFTTE